MQKKISNFNHSATDNYSIDGFDYLKEGANKLLGKLFEWYVDNKNKTQNMSSQDNPLENSQEPMLTTEDVAKELKVSRQAVHSRIVKGELIGYDFNGRYRVKRKDLNEFIEKFRVGSGG